MRRVWIDKLGALFFRSRLHRLWLRNRATVVLFHRVDDRLKGNPLSCSRREFRAFCGLFARHFRVISLPELLERLRSGADLSRRLVITFDDGYLDNYEIAAPILAELGLPASFFVTTSFIGSNVSPCWDREFGARSRWMSWDHVRSLHQAGFAIGAHTMTHASLGRVGAERIRAEVDGAKARLEDELGAPVTLFSTPFGGPAHVTDEARAMVREAGYECCLSTDTGVVLPGEDPFRIRRFLVTPWHLSPMQLGLDLLLARWGLAATTRPSAVPAVEAALG
ncbi:MAG TPA: polysaccharide deacetylase family protein [Longimicrobiales bacterium]|nr:polysaccharide deacetylase family protein [Longimicrobiales bacterium]